MTARSSNQCPSQRRSLRAPAPESRQYVSARVRHHDDVRCSSPTVRDPLADDDVVTESEESICSRVRERIRERVQQLHEAANAGGAPVVPIDRLTPVDPTSTVAKAASSADAHQLLGSLHQDVVNTAAQILGDYLAKRAPIDHDGLPIELKLVHRMLTKEAELQSLQTRRLRAGSGAH